MKRRIGLFGGTFDPIHYGHLQLAEIATQKCDLRHVVFIPAASPPHKNVLKITEFHHRVEMIRRALAGRTGFQLSLLESRLPSPSFTVDTLTFFLQAQEKNDDFYFIVGEDAFLDIKSWKSYDDLLSLTHFIVSGRPGYSPEFFDSFVLSLGYRHNGRTWTDPSGNKEVIFLPTATEDISSSAVREKIRSNMPLADCLPEAVIRYIRNHRLYAATPFEQ